MRLIDWIVFSLCHFWKRIDCICYEHKNYTYVRQFASRYTCSTLYWYTYCTIYNHNTMQITPVSRLICLRGMVRVNRKWYLPSFYILINMYGFCFVIFFLNMKLVSLHLFCRREIVSSVFVVLPVFANYSDNGNWWSIFHGISRLIILSDCYWYIQCTYSNHPTDTNPTVTCLMSKG